MGFKKYFTKYIIIFTIYLIIYTLGLIFINKFNIIDINNIYGIGSLAGITLPLIGDFVNDLCN